MHIFSNEAFRAVNWVNPYAKLINGYEDILKLRIFRERVQGKTFIIDSDLTFIVDSFLPNNSEIGKELSQPSNDHGLYMIVSLNVKKKILQSLDRHGLLSICPIQYFQSLTW